MRRAGRHRWCWPNGPRRPSSIFVRNGPARDNPESSATCAGDPECASGNEPERDVGEDGAVAFAVGGTHEAPERPHLETSFPHDPGHRFVIDVQALGAQLVARKLRTEQRDPLLHHLRRHGLAA